MVADYKFGDAPRSLVRVPGSGKDCLAPPVSCDLGRVSPLAATVSVNPYLPAIITGSKTAAPAPAPAQKLTSQVIPSGVLSPAGNRPSHRRLRSPDEDSVEGSSSKRPRLDTLKTEDAHVPKLVKVNTTLGPRLLDGSRRGFVSRQLTQTNKTTTQKALEKSNSKTSAPRTTTKKICTPNSSIEELLDERRELREENLALKQRLAVLEQMASAISR